MDSYYSKKNMNKKIKKEAETNKRHGLEIGVITECNVHIWCHVFLLSKIKF